MLIELKLILKQYTETMRSRFRSPKASVLLISFVPYAAGRTL